MTIFRDELLVFGRVHESQVDLKNIYLRWNEILVAESRDLSMVVSGSPKR